MTYRRISVEPLTPAIGAEIADVDLREPLDEDTYAESESRALLQLLFEHVSNPHFQCRFRWRANSIAFWDNRCVQHHAMWDYYPATRSGTRVTVAGDRPYH